MHAARRCAPWLGTQFRVSAPSFVFLLALIPGLQAQSAQAVAVISGYRDYNFGATVNPAPTGEKPQSKLWWNDGIWWGCLWDPAVNRYTIYKLNLGTQAWVNTGTRIDDRSESKADILWDGLHLFVVSNIYTTSPGPTTPSNSGRLYRFSYNASTDMYTLDAGFPVLVNGSRAETLVIDQDSTGQLWVTWIESGKVKVNRSLGDDLTWGQPFDLPVQGASTSSDDISSVVAFDSNKIGIMWSNQSDKKTYFAVHRDSNADTSWDPKETALSDPGGANVADDHLNLKMSCDGDGRLYAVTKTSLTGSSPLIYVLRRATDGTWSRSVFGTGTNNHTRPILILDPDNNTVHVFAMSNATGKEIVYRKSASTSNLVFPTGLGTSFIESSTDTHINNPTSTKQCVNGTTGLLVLASDNSSHYYLHNYMALAAAGPVIAGFDPPSGAPGTQVHLTGSGFSGATSVDFNGAQAGSFTIESDTSILAVVPPSATTGRIHVTNSAGTGESANDFVVLPPSSVLTFHPTDDAHVRSSSPSSNFGTSTTLRLRGGSPAYHAYLKFNVTGVQGAIQSARLRLFVTDDSPDGGSVHQVSNDYLGTSTPWNESGLTWSNAPSLAGATLANAGTTTLNTWVELDVTSAITGDGVYSFGIESSSTNSAIYYSDEGTNRPELLIDQTPVSIPTITFFDPDRGPVGTEVMIHGSKLASATLVEFGGTSASFVAEADTLIRATVPLGAQTSRIRVTNPAGAGESAADFLVTGIPVVTSFNPPSGLVGTEVTIIGSQFTGAFEVAFGGVPSQTFTIDDDSHIRAIVPGSAITGHIRVTNTEGAGESSQDFVVLTGQATLTFRPTDDAQVKSSNPTSNYGLWDTIRLRAGDPTYNSYLKFQVTGVAGTVASARLRLFVTDESNDGGTIYAVSNNYLGTATPWVETGLTWTNAPAIGGQSLSSAGPAPLGTWIELDVTSAVNGNGTFSFGITTGSTNSAIFNSDEGANPPELVVQVAQAGRVAAPAGAASTAKIPEQVPAPVFVLHPNVPNPFNPTTEIAFEIPVEEAVGLTIYDIQGRVVRVLIDGQLPAGHHRAIWDGRSDTGRELASGTYFLELAAGGRREVRKMVMVR